MKPTQIAAALLAALLLASAPVISFAQTPAKTDQQNQPRETIPDKKDTHSDGTAPQGMGSTGWTGGTGGSHIGTSNSLTTGENSQPTRDSGQPEMATGTDLQGPPARFPANRTPE